MIARGDVIGASAIADTGRRVLPTEWVGPAPSVPKRKPKARRTIARR